MNKFWFTSEFKVLFSNPGKNWVFVFVKNSFKNKQLKFLIVEPDLWSSDSVSLNTTSSLLISLLYEVIPTNPLIHPVKEKSVFPVYVINSSLICKRPYESGNPWDPVGDSPGSILIVVASKSRSPLKVTVSDRFVVSSNLIYLSIFWIKSIGPPWYSCPR